MSELEDVPTCKLVDELAKREGVEEQIVEPHTKHQMPLIDGPARILVVID